jgi:hypothetical protein
MGLDMYLYAEQYHSAYSDDKDESGRSIRLREDGDYSPVYTRLDAGYWRKHPNLHGFIVQTFADGKDECQDIYLNADMIAQIINAIEANALPKTEGFFFGESDGTEKDYDLTVFNDAIKWLNIKVPNVYKSIVYRASW